MKTYTFEGWWALLPIGTILLIGALIGYNLPH